MAEVVYILCALTSLACAVMLSKRHRETGAELLFWSAVAFVFFFLNNVALFVDLVLAPQTDLSTFRTSLALAGVVVLLYGLIKEK